MTKRFQFIYKLKTLSLVSVYEAILVIGVAFIPFTYALTIPWKFPIKIYEIVFPISFLLGSFMLERIMVGKIRNYAVLLGLLFLIAATSLIINYTFDQSKLNLIEYRFGPWGNSVAKLCYQLFVSLTFLSIVYLGLRRWDDVYRAWMVGALLSGIYSAYLTVVSALGVKPYLLPGLLIPRTFNIYNGFVIRSGTFMEGNFSALFYLMSAALATQKKNYGLAIFFSIIVLSTFSTIGFCSIILFWILRWIQYFDSTKFSLRLKTAILLVILGLGYGLTKTSYFQEVIVRKIFSNQKQSLVERTSQLMVSFDVFRDNMIFGVGLSRYGYLIDFKKYTALKGNPGNPWRELSPRERSLRPKVDDFTAKIIPNNIYVEILTEMGLLGFIVFGFFCFLIFRETLLSSGWAGITMGLAIAFIYLNFFPTFTVLFVWIYFALCVSHKTGQLKVCSQ